MSVDLDIIEELKKYVPMYLWERINHPPGYQVGHEEFNRRWNLTATQGDHNSETILNMVNLFISILEGGGVDPLSTIADVQFYDNGYRVTYTDDSVREWTYTVDGWGFITQLNNATDGRTITLGWHDESMGG